MKSEQYEELARFFIAKEMNIPISGVQSLKIGNPLRQDLPQYSHQIDLCWETSHELATYLNIANVKWRSSSKVDQPDILLLNQVRQKVGAHKAFLITNSEFTAGAIAAAKDDGIALHILTPDFDYDNFSNQDRDQFRASLPLLAAKCSTPIYQYKIEHRAYEASSSFASDRSFVRPGMHQQQGPSYAVSRPVSNSSGTAPRTGIQTAVIPRGNGFTKR